MSKTNICKVDKIYWGNTDNVWKPIVSFSFVSFEEAKEYIEKDKKNVFSYMHKYNVFLNIENY